jgi:signal transduction histidine kinase
MITTVDLIKIADRIADLTADERVRLGRILVDQYSQDACDVKDGIEDGFSQLEKELGLV